MHDQVVDRRLQQAQQQALKSGEGHRADERNRQPLPPRRQIDLRDTRAMIDEVWKGRWTSRRLLLRLREKVVRRAG